MSKKFKIMVDGVSHIVEVEEIGSSTSNYNETVIKNNEEKINIENKKEEKIVSNSVNPSANAITAPLQGTIQELKVTKGQQVKSGDIILIIEAMKMENEIVAPKDGVVGNIYVSKGQRVNSGDALIDIN